MEKIFISDFSEIHYDPSIKVVLMKCYPTNKSMSEREFHDQLNMLFNTVQVLEADKLYIDTYNFNHPILKTSVNLIKDFFAKYQLRKCVLVKSRCLMGSTGIQRLISKL